MSTPKSDIFDLAKGAGKAAPLQHAKNETAKPKRGRPVDPNAPKTRRKNLNVPVDFFARFEALKENGTLSPYTTLAAYMVDVFEEKLIELESTPPASK